MSYFLNLLAEDHTSARINLYLASLIIAIIIYNLFI